MVSVFLLLLDSMKVLKVLERERDGWGERERDVERRFWFVRGSNLCGVVLVSIYSQVEKKWEGEVRNRENGADTESGVEEEMKY